MLTQSNLKRFDRDFGILRHLCTNEYRSIPNSGNKNIYVPIHDLIDLGLIESKKGHGGGFKLTRPLDEIPFSYWLDNLSQHRETPTWRLLNLFKASTVEQLLQYPPNQNEGTVLLLDHTVRLLNRLSVDTPTLPSNVYCPLLKPGYLKHIFSMLVYCGLVKRIPRKGVLLTRNFDTLTLKDIIPTIPQDCRVFSGMVRCVADLKLKDLLTGEMPECHQHFNSGVV